jgi:mannosidase alpha-like ER degradation enhancer 1
MQTGQTSSTLVDSLSAFFPGVQTLMGDLDSAIKGHAVYAFQWLRYGGLPELFDTQKRVGVQLGYPLRPEFIESNMYLYQVRFPSPSLPPSPLTIPPSNE